MRWHVNDALDIADITLQVREGCNRWTGACPVSMYAHAFCCDTI